MVLPRADGLRPVAFAPDEDTAERWARVLEDAGIEAHIRIEDGTYLPGTGGLGSAYGAALGRAFVYPVLVSNLRHRAARRALARDLAPDPEPATITARSLATAVAVLVGSMLLVAYLAWVRGDL